MKNLLWAVSAIVVCSCGNGSSESAQQSPASDSVKLNTDSLNHLWIDDFKEFRNAVYTNNAEKAKAYFKFPVLNDNNEIWYLTDSVGSKNTQGDAIVPFTEKDFTRYFRNLFMKEFLTSILKVKAEELFKTGRSETIYFSRDSTTDYRMIASFDKEDKMLELNLFFNRNLKDENGDEEDGGESNIIYHFVVQDNGHLVFKDIRMAG